MTVKCCSSRAKWPCKELKALWEIVGFKGLVRVGAPWYSAVKEKVPRLLLNLLSSHCRFCTLPHPVGTPEGVLGHIGVPLLQAVVLTARGAPTSLRRAGRARACWVVAWLTAPQNPGLCGPREAPEMQVS